MKRNLKRNLQRVAGIAAAIAVALGVFSGGYVIGNQSPTEGEKESEFAYQFTKAAATGRDSDKAFLLNATAQAVGDPAFTRALVKVAYDWNRLAQPTETSLSAMQVMQQQKLIEQNAVIIEELREMNGHLRQIARK